MSILRENKIKTILPKANGLSGAFIFLVETFKEDNKTIWQPALAKVIAIQSTWNEKDWIKGINIKYLIELLENSDWLMFPIWRFHWMYDLVAVAFV